MGAYSTAAGSERSASILQLVYRPSSQLRSATMIPVLSRAQMQAFDRFAIDSCGLPGVVLMENAGRGAAEIAARLLGARLRGARVAIVCGTGNNGGDGFVVGRHLWSMGASVEVLLVGSSSRVQGDARINLDAFVRLGGAMVEIATGASLAGLEASLSAAHLVVDALFGTGLDRPIDGQIALVIDAINRTSSKVLALDLPSGLDADTGASLGACVVAAETACFGHLKPGLLTPQAARFVGRVNRCGLGVPDSVVSRVGHVAEVIARDQIARLFAPRALDAHKYSVGAVLLCAGSSEKSGAALLCARGAFRAGAGLVTIATWPGALFALQGRMPEVMVHALDGSTPGTTLEPLLANRRAVVVGPGFGLDEAAVSAVAYVVRSFAGPLVVDADGLTIYRENAAKLRRENRATILTPHAGELARLLGISSAEVERDRFSAVRALVEVTGAIVVLKGSHTLVAGPDGRIAINTTGNPILATAGSGDVLAGVIAALACVLDPFDAACAGAHVHGTAGDVLRARGGDRGALASEIADVVPCVIDALIRRDASVLPEERLSFD